MPTAVDDLRTFPVSPSVGSAANAVMFAAMARARALGLTLPPYLVLWVRAPGADCNAQTHTPKKGQKGYARIYLRDDLSAEQTYETMLHELAHVADARILGSLGDVAEERAETFVARASQASRRPWLRMMATASANRAEPENPELERHRRDAAAKNAAADAVIARLRRLR